MNESTPGLAQVIKIDEAQIQDHLGQVVRSTVEETLNRGHHRSAVGYAGERRGGEPAQPEGLCPH